MGFHGGSVDGGNLKKALHTGVIPAAYEDVISDMEVKKVRRKASDEGETKGAAESIYGTAEEIMERAKEGYFARDPERNRFHKGLSGETMQGPAKSGRKGIG